MKKQILITLIIAIATSITVNAQKITLHSTSGVQLFTGDNSFVNAYNASQNGDTIYLPGGSFIPPAAFDKKLMIFGAGHYVDSTLATGKTFINGNFTLDENADLFYLEGVEITGNMTFSTNHSVNNVIIKRCKINVHVQVLGNLGNPTTNLGLIGNVILGDVDLSNAQNALISNNIIQGIIVQSIGNFVSNNIFLNQKYIGCWTSISGNNNQINNNYFPGNFPICGAGNTLNNNLFFSEGPDYGVNPIVSNSYLNVPMSIAFISHTNNIFNYSNNYHLQSPSTYLGNDGLQVGIYGGTFPYKEGAVPQNPHIQLKNIAPTTDANGNLQIQIQVKAQNN